MAISYKFPGASDRTASRRASTVNFYYSYRDCILRNKLNRRHTSTAVLTFINTSSFMNYLCTPRSAYLARGALAKFPLY